MRVSWAIRKAVNHLPSHANNVNIIHLSEKRLFLSLWVVFCNRPILCCNCVLLATWRVSPFVLIVTECPFDIKKRKKNAQKAQREKNKARRSKWKFQHSGFIGM